MERVKKKKLKIIIPVVIAAAVIASILLIRPVRALIAMNSMTPLDSQEVMTDIYAIKDSFVNLYLFKSGEKYIAFDAGADAKTTKMALDSLSIDENDIIAVFLTHTDGDHVAAVPFLPSAEIYMSDSNRDFLNERDGRSRSKTFIDMEREYLTLGDGETIIVAGTRVQCIFAPGHTTGSSCYIVNGKYLFAGDNFNLNNGKAVLFNSVFNMSNDMQTQSLRKLSNLGGIEAVFTMHTGYTADFKAAFAEWLE